MCIVPTHTVSRYQTKTVQTKRVLLRLRYGVLRRYSATPGQFSVLTLPLCQCAGFGPGHVLTNVTLHCTDLTNLKLPPASVSALFSN